MIKLLRVASERLSLYLPVILMALLALGTYWLVRNTPLLMQPEQRPPLRHEPDYFMHTFSVKTFDEAGRLKNDLMGTDVHHYPDTDTLEIELVRIRSFDETGRLTTASAKHAVTNRDASEVRFSGDARVVREPVLNQAGKPQPRMEFRSEFLYASINTKHIQTNQPVELTRGNDHFTADTMDFDRRDSVILLKGRVKGRLMPNLTNGIGGPLQ